MAHATDYSSIHDIARVRMSPSSMNPSKQKEINATTLVSNFIRNNPTWSIDSLFNYCMVQYTDFSVTPAIIAGCMKDYINSKGGN